MRSVRMNDMRSGSSCRGRRPRKSACESRSESTATPRSLGAPSRDCGNAEPGNCRAAGFRSQRDWMRIPNVVVDGGEFTGRSQLGVKDIGNKTDWCCTRALTGVTPDVLQRRFLETPAGSRPATTPSPSTSTSTDALTPPSPVPSRPPRPHHRPPVGKANPPPRIQLTKLRRTCCVAWEKSSPEPHPFGFPLQRLCLDLCDPLYFN
jgi:hypothetical protein